MEDELITVPEARSILRCRTETIYLLIRLKLIPSLKFSRGRTMLRKKWLFDFLDEYSGYDLSNPLEIKEIQRISEEEAKEKLRRRDDV